MFSKFGVWNVIQSSGDEPFFNFSLPLPLPPFSVRDRKKSSHPQKCLNKNPVELVEQGSQNFLIRVENQTALKSFKDPCFTGFTGFSLGFCEVTGGGVKMKKGPLFER